MTNRMVLSGMITRHPIRKKSPSGITHNYFWIEHRSVGQEAGLNRNIYCIMQVVISGEEDYPTLEVGKYVEVEGFVQYQKDKNGIGKCILHAEKVTYIND